MRKEEIKHVISKMTLEEKVSLCSGADFWYTKGFEHLGIPQMMVADGPHGLRKQNQEGDHLGINESIQSVCFPAGCASASSFDRELIKKMGEILGQECQAEGVGVLLGPAVNIKRSPLCGRNFEYYSEDPFVTSEIAGAFIEGVQSKKVGTSIKHFLANNQEHRRMTSSSEVDERTLREIYLAAFEGAVRSQKPWTVMSAYNRVNGVFVGESSQYLTTILRDEWGFDGFVMSDWGAVNDKVAGLQAGMELEMPSSNGIYDLLVIEAVQNGNLKEEIVDEACLRILNVVYRFVENRSSSTIFDREKDHSFARKVAEESIILLKNKEDILPLSTESKIAFIGEFAATPRYQGGGSSHINSFKVSAAVDEVKKLGMQNITYSKGYEADKDQVLQALKDEAVMAAQSADIAVIFAGLPDHFESEGYDRTHMRIPHCQNDLIDAVCEIQPNTVVVLHNGSPIEMPWIDKVKGVVEAYLGGQAIGEAIVNVLFGKVNPSGRLAETFPKKLEDNPSYLFFKGEKDIVEYREGVFVGYRYYETKKIDVLFPFGHGLSYTQFAYSNMTIDRTKMKDTELLTVEVEVTNIGERAGKEVVQLYICPPNSEVIRPVIELRGFEKVTLEAGEKKKVSFTLDKRAFAYWEKTLHDWHVVTGEYKISIGKSARELLLAKEVYVEATKTLSTIYHMNSTMGDIMKDPKGKKILEAMQAQMLEGTGAREMEQSAQEGGGVGVINDEMLKATMENMPLRQLLSFVPGIQKEQIQQLINALNNH